MSGNKTLWFVSSILLIACAFINFFKFLDSGDSAQLVLFILFLAGGIRAFRKYTQYT